MLKVPALISESLSCHHIHFKISKNRHSDKLKEHLIKTDLIWMKQDWPEQHLEPHTDCVRKPKAAALLAGHPVITSTMNIMSLWLYMHTQTIYCSNILGSARRYLFSQKHSKNSSGVIHHMILQKSFCWFAAQKAFLIYDTTYLCKMWPKKAQGRWMQFFSFCIFNRSSQPQVMF